MINEIGRRAKTDIVVFFIYFLNRYSRRYVQINFEIDQSNPNLRYIFRKVRCEHVVWGHSIFFCDFGVGPIVKEAQFGE